MSQAEQLNFAPPRIPCISAVPTPQTCYGTLEHSGLPYADQSLITDIPPDLSWMSGYLIFQGSFEMSKNQAPGTAIYDLSPLGKNATDYIFDQIPQWPLIPFTGSKYWNGAVTLRFLAIKPPRVTGKLVLRYQFPVVSDYVSGDKQMRGITKEWDLGQSNVCDFDITALNPANARPTWIPMTRDRIGAGTDDHLKGLYNTIRLSPIRCTAAQTAFGWVWIEVAQRLQPGGIFPDQIRILVFRGFKNATFYTPTDFRGAMPNVLSWDASKDMVNPPPI